MPSFTKRVPTSSVAPPRGTIPSPSSSTPPLYLLPTGVPSLDDILGGGLPLGSVFLLLTPDKHTQWSKVVERYWTARGLVDGQKGVMIGERGDEVVRGCMWVDKSRSTGEGGGGEVAGRAESVHTGRRAAGAGGAGTGAGSESEGEDAGLKDVSALGENRPKIAWRYEGMSKFQTGLGKSDHGELTLLKTIPPATIATLEKNGTQRYITLEPTPASSTPSSSKTSPAWSIMSSVLTRLQDVLDSHDDKQALRVTIHELGNTYWGSPSSQEMPRFIHAIKGMIRSKSVGVMITLPADLASGPPPPPLHPSSAGDFMTSTTQSGAGGEAGTTRWIKKLAASVDACIELKGFGDNPTLPPLFHPLHGLITPHSLPTTHHLLPPSYKHSSLLGLSSSSSTSGRGGGAGENNLGFRLSRKRLVFETVHLGIEGGTGERRTEPAPDTSGLTSISGVEKPLVATGGVSEHSGDVKRDGTPKAEAEESQTPAARKKKSKGVRFTESTEIAVTVADGGDEGDGGVHGSGRGSGPARVMARHDKMDLYEF